MINKNELALMIFIIESKSPHCQASQNNKTTKQQNNKTTKQQNNKTTPQEQQNFSSKTKNRIKKYQRDFFTKKILINTNNK
ncbi:hypothetical protein [Dickeya oryzae]|uniref:hypothetical protein n=1 Tax=Dickeya oryzae TaxID=1240404 RepID=UPI0012974208|nr:hypothetical protein [Dickeya oryzae]